MERYLRLRNETGEVAKLNDWLAREIKPAGYSQRDFFRLELALNEAVTNVIDYAFPEGGAHEIGVELRKTPESTSVTIVDEGRAFDPLQAPRTELASSLEEAQPGGVGILLIRNYCDNCSYERIGAQNRLTLLFRATAPML